MAIAFAFGDTRHPEMYEHGAIAHNLLAGHGYAMHWPYESLDSTRRALMAKPIDHEGAFIPPLNPYIIYSAYIFFGESPAAALTLMLFYAGIGALLVPLIYKTSLLIADELGARIAAIIAAFFFPAAYAVVTFSGSVLYHLFAVLVFFYGIRLIQRRNISDGVLLGISCGVLTMLRSEFFILGFILIAVAGFSSRTKERVWQKNKLFLSSAAVCVAMIAPWTIRNYILFDRFVPVLSHPWYEIWRGNNTYVAGGSFLERPTYIWINPKQFPDIVRKMDAVPYDRFFEPTVNDIFKAEAEQFVAASPGSTVILALKKLALLFTVDVTDVSARRPLYVLMVIPTIILIVTGILNILKHSLTKYEGMLFLVFAGYYILITIATYDLPRYQIYLLMALLPVISCYLKWHINTLDKFSLNKV
ncbi:MAG TPA: glycosyltransferase family 39 protein [Candidatus Kapabacteria bacterium]|nr:glycosyltransferase family 39 protein [Candidatus Kapabacteria bacterium]